MRQIKFRCWSPDNQEMYFPDQDYCFKVYNDSVGFYPHYDSNELSDFNTNPCDGELKIEVMQWTGLVDKNGVDIYEGDVANTKFQKIAVIKWDNEHACFCTETIDEIVKDERMYCLSDVIEIIGNIHQHPELLTSHQGNK